MMSDLKATFESKSNEVKDLSKKPDNMTMLSLYALFKQATKGDVEGSRPGMMKMVERAKWDAWSDRKGMSSEAAMQAYVDLVQGLQDAD